MRRFIFCVLLLCGCSYRNERSQLSDVESINHLSADRVTITYRNGSTYEFVLSTESRKDNRKYLFIKSPGEKEFKLYELAP